MILSPRTPRLSCGTIVLFTNAGRPGKLVSVAPQLEALEALLDHERGEGRAREQRHKLTVERLRRQIADLQVPRPRQPSCPGLRAGSCRQRLKTETKPDCIDSVCF